MIIKVDVDGVIRDIITTMCSIYNDEFGENISPKDIRDYDVNKYFPLIKERIGMKPTDYFFDVNANKVFETVSKPFEGVQDAIERLRANGNKVVIVTWQFNVENIKHTLDFLEKYGITYDDICFTKDKWIVNGDYLIDDNPEFINDPRDKSRKLLVDTPYNKGICGTYRRVKSLRDAVDYIILSQKEKDKAA